MLAGGWGEPMSEIGRVDKGRCANLAAVLDPKHRQRREVAFEH
jgi:hypothetical protein